MKWRFLSFLHLATTILIIGCVKDKSEPTSSTPEKVVVNSVSLNKSSISLMEGTSETLIATVAPSNADNKVISWKSSDTGIAYVDTDGKVTAVKAGTATITVTTLDGNKTATCTVSVMEKPTISVTGNTADVPVTGASIEFAISYNIAYTVQIEADSQSWIHFVETRALQSGTLVFSIDANDGPARSGKAMVKANDGSAEAITLTFNQEGIIPVSSILLNIDTLALEIGEVFSLEATLTPDEATDKTVEWRSDKPEVATVEDGVVTAMSVGSAIITAMAGEQAATCTVSVMEKPTIIVTGNTADVPVTGARIEFAISYNIAYTVQIEADSQSWIHFVETRALQSGTLVFSVDANDGPARCGKATVKPKDRSMEAITLTFNQEGFIPVASITLNNDTLELEIGEVYTLEATLTPDEATDKTLEWSSDKPEIAIVEDGVITAMSAGSAIITAMAGEQIASCSVTVTPPINEIERDALIALYNALDGDNWKNNENWCSEKPLNEWFGIITDEKGCVIELNVPFDNNAKGEIPQAIAQLGNLKRLYLSGMDISGVLPRDIFQITSLENILINCLKMEPVDLKGIGALKKLKSLFLNKVSGGLPEEIGFLTELQNLTLRSAGLDGIIPETVGNLKQLTSLDLRYNTLRGVIPASIGELTNLSSLLLMGNRLNGSIPKELGKLSGLTDLDLSDNLLSGTIPELVQRLPNWPSFCWSCIYNNQFRPADVMDALSVPDFSVTCLNGYQYDSKTEFKKNKFTLLHKTATTIDDIVLNSIKDVYEKYHSKGLDCLTYVPDDFGADLGWMENYVSTRGIKWPSFLSTKGNCIYPSEVRMATAFPVFYISPTHVLVDSEGKVVSYSFGSADDCISYLKEYFGDAENTLYTSSDYSLDGRVSVLQSSDTGPGIDLIFMGDAFSDRQIKSEYYSSVMNNAMDCFFSVEPYKSFKNLFNVYRIDVVSQNEGYDNGCKPALGTWISDDSFNAGLNDKRVFSYALRAIAPERLDEALIVVMMNAEKYGGVAKLYNNHRGDYGSGTGVAYVPITHSLEEMKYVLLHEAGGHGFSKLADEYDYPGRVTEDFVYNHHFDEIYGFWKNVDFTSDPQSVKWAPFIVDERYSGEGIGVFEGACGYSQGVWRPSENSIMRHMSNEFNAPSRYAIWHRIGKLAYGEDWAGTYEDFVAYDKINRAPSGVRDNKKRSRTFVERPLPLLLPPIVTGHSWREAF